MKRTVKVKNLIAFAAVLILLIFITAIPAFAEFPPLTTAGRRLGSWILATLTAANITLTSSVSASQGADLINFLADPLDVTYSYTEMWDDRPTIQIWDDYTTIDGVTYTDVWLSNEAASKFKTDGMDFATAYSIASNSNGTFASGEGYVEGLPVFLIDNQLHTQSIEVPKDLGTYSVGSSTVENIYRSSGSNQVTWKDSLDNNIANYWQYHSQYPTLFKFRATTDDMALANFNGYYQFSGEERWRLGSAVSSKVNQPFDFDYIAGTIDADPLASDEGLMIRVPSNSVPDLQDFLTDNPEFGQPGGTTIDVNVDPDIMNKLDDLINIIAPIIPILNNNDINFTVNHVEPQPQPQPDPAPDVDPDTPIIDITYNDYYQTITNQTEYINNTVNNINNNLNDINENVSNVNDNLDSIENYTRNIWDDTAHIDAGVTYISQDTTVMVENQDTIIENQDTIIQNQDQVLTNHDTIISNQDTIIQNQDIIIENQDTIIEESIPEIIENIPKINDICNNIDTAPYHDLDTGLDRLPTFLLPFITDLRSALGIWHYVTEWLDQISTTFAFISGCLVGTSIMTPIYAAIAGFMCIKIYRRMTA